MQKSSIEERFDLGKETLDRAISRKIPEYASKSLSIAYKIYGRLYPDQKKEEELNSAYIRVKKNAARIEVHVKGKEDAKYKDDFKRNYERICGTFVLKRKEDVLSISEDDDDNLEEFAEIKLS